MSLNLLEHVAFAYQPIWGASRQLTGVRLRVRALAPDSVDAVHLLELLAEGSQLQQREGLARGERMPGTCHAHVHAVATGLVHHRAEFVLTGRRPPRGA